MNKNERENIVEFFGQEKDILAFVSTRKAGNFRGDVVAVENLIASIGFSDFKVAMGSLVHDKKIFEAKKDNFSSTEMLKNTDGLMTREKNIFLAITFADCLPVFFYHSNEKIVGLLHVGWRGAAKGIVEEFLENIEKEKRKDLKVVLGPSIGWKNYEFDLKTAQENFTEFSKRIKKSAKRSKCYLDVKGVVIDKLLKNGISKNNIIDSKINTFSDERFFSHRKRGSDLKKLKACVAVVGIVK